MNKKQAEETAQALVEELSKGGGDYCWTPHVFQNLDWFAEAHSGFFTVKEIRASSGAKFYMCIIHDYEDLPLTQEVRDTPFKAVKAARLSTEMRLQALAKTINMKIIPF